MIKPWLAPLALAVSVRAARAQQPTSPLPTPPQPPVADSNDVRSVDAILHALYDVISGPAGKERDWNRFRSLFAPGARLVPTRPRAATGGAEALVLDIDGYINRAGPYLVQNGFFEREIARRLEMFGNIAHAFSTYASYRTQQDSAPFARGINSIQLLKDGSRWWVVTIFWDAERPGLVLPRAYLPPPSER